MNLATKLSAMLVVGFGLTGCATDGSGFNDFFPEEGPDRKVNQFINSQANNGARDDAMLRDMHFEGNELSALGTEKLARMVPDGEANGNSRVTVYLNISAEDQATGPRRESVMSYLKACGLSESQIDLKVGANPAADYPAAPGLARMSKTESGGPDAAGGEEGGSEGDQSMSAGDMK